MDTEELDYEIDWAPEDSRGYEIGVNYKLGDCVPVMCDPIWSEVIFTAGGKFYVWNQLAGSHCQILFPTLLDEIIIVKKDKGLGGLKWKNCDQSSIAPTYFGEKQWPHAKSARLQPFR